MAKMRAGFVALAFLGWCGFAHALALGEIEVHSRLNQVLAADIPLSVTTPGEADDLVVELASNDEFDKAGMERSEFLSTLRFVVDGTTIKVSSKKIAREPFISFLLNVRWANGRLLREYTVLLDPPPAGESAGISRPQLASSQPSGEPAPAATSSAAAKPAAKAAAPAAAPASAEQAAPEAPAASAAPASPASASGGMYGPVSPKETLWSIAYKLRPDPSLTMDQMQVAFFNANPKAFDNGKLTGLMKGSMLRVPTIDEIRAVDPASAKVQVAAARNAAPAPVLAARAHPTAPAEPAPAPAPARAEPTPAPAPAAKAEPAPQAVTPPPDQPAAPQPPPDKAPPAAVAPVPQQAPAATSAAAPSEAPETTPAPAPAPASAVAAKKPAKPANPTVAAPPAEQNDLVSTILTTVKDLADSESVRYALAGLVALIILIVAGKKVGGVIAKARYERASRKQVEERMAPMTGGNEEVTQVAQSPSMQESLDEASADSAAASATQSMAPAAATQVMGETMQQTMQQTQVQEPAAAQSGQVDFDVTGSFADQTVQIKLDAGDPVSEAEFHRAYGLYDEAALLLKQALQKDPKRTDARVKLAEIYFEASKAKEFVEVAKELKGQLPDAEWQKIALLGSQIAADNELFSGGGAGVGGTVDLSFDEPAAAPAPAAPAAPAPAADAGLDFKFEDVQLDVPAQAPAAPAAPAEGALEFDLGGLSLDTPAAPAAAPQAAPAAPASSDAGLDLGNFDLGAAPAAPAEGGGEVVELSADLPTGDGSAGGDESSTKLDLARAYIDMGDNDMAKSLLNEVNEQGNDQQKKEAQELLKRVAA